MAAELPTAAGAPELCDYIWQLDDPAAPAVAGIAKQAASFAADADLIVGCLEAVANEAKEAGNDGQLAAVWTLADRLCKSHQVFIDALRPKVVDLASRFPLARASPHFGRFAQILESFKAIFGTAVMAMVSIKLKDVLGAEEAAAAGVGGAPTTVPNAAAVREAAVAAAESQAKQNQLSTVVRSVGGFQMQRANNARPAGAQHALQVKTRDSLQAVRGAAMYAPAVPQEITVAMPERDADAPVGHMQALPANHRQEYLDARKKRFREMAEKWRQEEDRQRQQPAARDAAGGDAAGPSKKVDLFEDVVMPAELPRDDFGVKIGNFPEGVRFLREAIRACGGALELTLLEERVSQMSDREAQAEFGNLRQFLHIHQPTFRVVDEHDRWIVRLVDAEDPDPAKPLTWEKMECPMCSFMCRGRNYAKHLNCRRCIDIQITKGLSGRPFGPIGDLAYAARTIVDASQTGTLDDDDVMFFADSVRRAGEVSRFKYASTSRFAPILKALRVVRDTWLASKNVKEMADAPVTEEDGPYVAVFAAFGANLRRLPVRWIETGDIIDMAKRFTTELLQPHPPVPRAGDPRIKVGNAYPGFMFAESDSDPDDAPSSEDEEYSDDEAAQFEFAPPVSIMETIMAAGNERETKKINFRLRTAPPVPAATAIKGDGTKTVGQVYKAGGN